jgi:DNA-directed RNA polymerase subunit M/transcription elongation factor TFIIS
MDPTFKGLFETRECVVNKLKTLEFSHDEAVTIEKSIMSHVKQHALEKHRLKFLRWSNVIIRRIYTRKYRSIVFNMENIKRLIKAKSITLEETAHVDQYTLAPEMYASIFETRRLREMHSALADATDAHDGILKCEACGSMKTRYVEVQTRSGDEPLTVFARCLACEVHWTLDGK